MPSTLIKPRLRTLTALACVLAMQTSACGYRGPLYLPDEDPPGAGTGAQTGADVNDGAEGEDEEEEDNG